MNVSRDPSQQPLLSIIDLKTTINTSQGVIPAVNGISIHLERGRTLAIVGESGSGKSILCKSILGLLPGQALLSRDSRILFQGRDICKMSTKELNTIRGRHMAMIFQDPLSSLNPVMTVGKQIAETLIFHEKLEKRVAMDRAEGLLKSLGIPDPGLRLHQFPHELSGGLRQRVAIAIAIACKPELLIADEPTTALDVTVQAEILELLVREQKKRDMAIILITHDLSIAAARAHHIAVMYAGKLVEQAPAANLFHNTRMPYTQALIDSIPRLETLPHTLLKSIPGQPPDPAHLPKGCSFAPRCIRAVPLCRESTPELTNMDDPDHWFACFNPLGYQDP